MPQLVKPNGWVFAIDCDLCNLSAADPGHRDASRFDEVCRKAAAYNQDHYNINYRMGRSLSKLFEEAGLVDVNNSAWTSVSRGGSLQAEFWRRTWEVSGQKMKANGALSRQEHELRLSAMTDPTFRVLGSPLFPRLWEKTFPVSLPSYDPHQGVGGVRLLKHMPTPENANVTGDSGAWTELVAVP